jgi:hypothetical protein
MSPSLLTITAMKTLAMIAAVTIAVLSGCSMSSSEYNERIYRGMPTKAAYNDYKDAQERAESALNHAKFGVKASNQAPNITNKIRYAYGAAGSAVLYYCTNRSPFPKDTAKLRATADEQMKAATALFKANSANLKLWCDNYYEIEAAVLQADALAARAMASTSPQ